MLVLTLAVIARMSVFALPKVVFPLTIKSLVTVKFVGLNVPTVNVPN